MPDDVHHDACARGFQPIVHDASESNLQNVPPFLASFLGFFGLQEREALGVEHQGV